MEQEIAKALEQGVSVEEIINALVQQGANPEEAAQMVQAVQSQMQGGGEGGAITAEQAAQALSEIGLTQEQIVATVQLILNMNPAELDKLLGALQGGGQQTEQPQEDLA